MNILSEAQFLVLNWGNKVVYCIVQRTNIYGIENPRRNVQRHFCKKNRSSHCEVVNPVELLFLLYFVYLYYCLLTVLSVAHASTLAAILLSISTYNCILYAIV